MKSMYLLTLVTLFGAGSALASNHSISGGTTNDSGGTSLYECTDGFYLKSNRSGGKWPEVSMGAISDSAKIQNNDVKYTCQYHYYKDSECNGSLPQKNTDITGKDICVANGAIITTNSEKSTCPSSPSDDDTYRVTAGVDQCFYYKKPTAKGTQGSGTNR